MARFDKYLTPATNMASRLVSLQLRRQSPVKTGRLRKSIHIRANRTDEGVTFVATYLDYGTFTDTGTGPYGVQDSDRRSWDPIPGKGKGGIKPRFWLSLDDIFLDNINDMLAEAVERAIEEEIDDIL